MRRRAIDAAVAFVTERLNGEDGLGAIYPAMANAVLMFDALGYRSDHPTLVVARKSIERLLVVGTDEAYCQPCLSPVWDTALAAHALLEAGDATSAAPVRAALEWLKPRQILDVKGDWAARRPDVRPGGWAFQYANPHYPDIDDTAVVAMAMDRADRGGFSAAPDAHSERSPARANGSRDCKAATAAGPLSMPTTPITISITFPSPIMARCSIRRPPTSPRAVSPCSPSLARRGKRVVLARGIDALNADQEKDGSWFGRWGLNYIYGTWSALCALGAAGQDPRSEPVRRAVEWLVTHSERRRRLGRERRELQARLQGFRVVAERRLADSLGAARADGGGRGRPSGRGPRRRLSRGDTRKGRLLG